jgi:hypothetical protein
MKKRWLNVVKKILTKTDVNLNKLQLNLLNKQDQLDMK